MLSLPVIEPLSVAQRRHDRLVASRRKRLAKMEDERKWNEFLVLKSEVVKARLEVFSLDWRKLEGGCLILSLLTFTKLDRWVFNVREGETLARAVVFARACYLAARANKYVAAYLELKATGWSEREVFTNPPIRLVFEEASAIGGLGECIDATKFKSWGNVVGIEPVPVDLEVLPENVGYLYHETSRYNRRFNQRRRMKKLLRKDGKLVKDAMGETKKRFLEKLTEQEQAVISRRFGIGPDVFWRAVNGKEWLDLPREFIQLELF